MGIFNRAGSLCCLQLAAAASAFQCGPLLAADQSGRATVMAAEDEALFDTALLTSAAGCVRPCPPCPPNPCPPNVLQPDQVFPTNPPPMGNPQASPQSNFSNQQPMSSLAAGQGAISGQDYVPGFFGDFFAGPATTIDSVGPGVVALPIGSAVGIMKFVENSSPIPRDRFYVNYSYFDGVNMIPGKLDVRRLTPGFEKTFFNGTTSFELRAPMANTLNSTTMFDAGAVAVSGYDTTNYELGNLTGFFKALLYQNDVWALSTGLGVTLPTADDQKVVNDDGSGQVFNKIKNSSVHLLPFVGAVATPTDRWFLQGVLQFDAGLNGNSVYGFDGARLIKEGTLNDPNWIFVSLGQGYWIYQAADQSSVINRIALINEFHFNNTLGKTDQIVGQTATFSDALNIQTINSVMGANIIFDQNKSLMLGYTHPIGGGNDRAFNGEFRAIFNWYFGPNPLNRQTRIQF